MVINAPSPIVHSSARSNAQPLAASTVAFADILTQAAPLAKRARGNSQPPPLTRSSTPCEAAEHESSASYSSAVLQMQACTHTKQGTKKQNTRPHAEDKLLAHIAIPPHPTHFQQAHQAFSCPHSDTAEHAFNSLSFDLANMLPVAAPTSEIPWRPALSSAGESGDDEEEDGEEEENPHLLLDFEPSLELGETLDLF